MRSRRFVDLIRIAAVRDLRVRYRGSALGIVWSFANPVLMTAVYTAIFGTAFSRYYDGSVTRYLTSAFVGLAVVTFFLAATAEALPSIVAGGPLLNKIAVPPIVFPLAAVAANVFQQAVTTFPIVFLLSVFLTGDIVRVLLVVPVLFATVVLATGFAVGLSALYVYFRDLPHLWAIAGFMLWLTSALFYPLALVPPNVRAWYVFNPVAQAIAALREVTLNRGPIDADPIVATFVGAAIAAALGWWLFGLTRRDFMDLV